MGLLSIFKRTGEASAAPAPESGDAVLQARVQARRRLIGATVLLVIGVIGFPLVFETRPRPIPVDIPIEIPRKENAPPLAMPAARPAGPTTVPPVPQPPLATDAGVITESRNEAGREVAARAPTPTPDSPRRATTSSNVPEAPKVATAPLKPAPEATKAAAPANLASASAAKPAAPVKAAPVAAEANRAQALLESKPSASAASQRFVVQVGAFAEAESARETRQKVEKLGLKAYTQVAQTPSGSRIRVRIGPFGTRAEADAALAKARAAGLNPVVLTL